LWVFVPEATLDFSSPGKRWGNALLESLNDKSRAEAMMRVVHTTPLAMMR
jgi:hypothetical protein